MSNVLWMRVTAYQVNWGRVLKRIHSHPDEVQVENEFGKTVLYCALTRRVTDYPPYRVVEAMVKTCPALLIYRDNRNCPLIAACSRRATLEILQLLTGVALLMRNPHDIKPHDVMRPLIVLWDSHLDLARDEELLVDSICNGGREGGIIWTKIYSVLQYCSFALELNDIATRGHQRTNLISTAVWAACDDSAKNTSLLTVLLEQFPEQARLADCNGRLPLHLLFHKASHAIVDQNMPDLEKHMINEAFEKKTRLLLSHYEHAAKVRCNKGRLPLHLAVDRSETPWHCISDLISACPTALNTPDPYTHLYPFQLAASSSNPHSITTIYSLLRASPHLVSPDNRFIKNKSTKAWTSAEEPINDVHTGRLPLNHEDFSFTLNRLTEVVTEFSKSDQDWKAFLTTMNNVQHESSMKNHLLHALCSMQICSRSFTVGFIRLFLKMCPDQASIMDRNGNMPLHVASSTALQTRTHSIHTEQIEHLFSHDNDDDATISVALARLKALAGAFPQAARIRNKQGMLPLHLAIITHQPIEVVEFLWKTWPDALLIRDGECMLYAPLLAATMNCPTDIIYRLVRVTPHIHIVGP